MNRKKKSRRVSYGICTVSVRFLYKVTAVPRTTRVIDGGITEDDDATTVRYSTCTVKPVEPWAPTICLIYLDVGKVFYEII